MKHVKINPADHAAMSYAIAQATSRPQPAPTDPNHMVQTAHCIMRILGVLPPR